MQHNEYALEKYFYARIIKTGMAKQNPPAQH